MVLVIIVWGCIFLLVVYPYMSERLHYFSGSGMMCVIVMSQDERQQKEHSVAGVVDESLPNAEFRVVLETGDMIVAYLSGKMRLHRIKVLVGDKVQVVVDPYGGKGRIMRRF